MLLTILALPVVVFSALTKLPDEINDNAWSNWTEKIISRTNVKPKTLYMDLRFILTGRKFGPSMNNLLTLFQREEILRRIELNCE